MAWHSRRVICASVAPKGPTADASRRSGRLPAFLPFDFESILPAQWTASDGGRLQPAKRLMLAILTDAVELVLQEPAPAARVAGPCSGKPQRGCTPRTRAGSSRS